MSKINRQTTLHNEKMRKVRHISSYQYPNFLEKSRGDLLINGGLKEKRRECLLDFITHTRRKENRTIFIFSDDTQLEEELINRAQNGYIGKTFICNQCYPVYDFFCGIKKSRIAEYFNHLSTEKGFTDVGEINSYTDSFLSILSEKMPVNLTSLTTFSKNDDTSIKNSANNPSDGDTILASTKGGVSFRSLLNTSADVFSSLTTNKCATNFCLSNLTDKDCVVLINTPADDSEFFSIYFAMELKSILDRNFICIFDDSIMMNNDTMRSIIALMKQRHNIDVVVSHENIVSVSDTDDVIKDFNRNLILLNGNTSDVDMQKVLSTFGQYTHMQAMANQNSPPKLFFTLLHGEGEAPVQYVRDRILIQEENGNEALLKGGSSSEILITKRLLT